MTTSYHPDYSDTNTAKNSIEEETKSSNIIHNRPFLPSPADDLTKSQSCSVSPPHHQQTHQTLRNSKIKASHSSITLSSTMPNSMNASPSRLYMNKINGSSSKSKLTATSNVEKIISITPTCYLKPKCFFVAWNSVITLVFNGWPEPVDTMKTELSSSCTLCKEYFGSKFPKITIACVKDGIEMTPKLLAQVRRLCAQEIIPKDYVLCMDALSVVLYENRSQESIIYEKIIPLKKNHKFLGSPRPLLLNLEEDDDAPYLRSANRTSHYRSLVIGSSIVHRLIHVPKFITDFQAKLPKEIFDTFSKDSLHVTIRALC